jgi:3-oxoacyl-[acyl-carrier protein] reductase
MMELENKVAIVTGASRGIGRAIAVRFARAGANVVLAARSMSDLEQVAAEIEPLGRSVLAVKTDVTNEAEDQNLIDRTVDRFGSIDILVNNAGIGYFRNVEEMSAQEFDAMWAVNVRGVFLCSKFVLPHMRRQQSGDIINISSLAGRNSFVGGSGYSATKWALIGFARSMMLEVREHNIRVVTLCPGSVDTAFNHPLAGQRPRRNAIPQAEDIADVALDTIRMPRHVMVSEVDIRPTNPKG